MDREKVRQDFIDAAVRLGAGSGLSAITSRSLESEAKTNQYYMYRVFDSVEDVMLQAANFARDVFIHLGLDCLEVYETVDAIGELDETVCAQLDFQFFASLWRGMKGNDELFTFYLRYYYAYIFPKKYSNDGNAIVYQPLLEKMAPLFKPNTDLIMVVMHVLETMIRFVAMVRAGVYADNEKTDALVFRFTFSVLYPYLARTPEIESQFEL